MMGARWSWGDRLHALPCFTSLLDSLIGVRPHSEGVIAIMIIQQTYHTYKHDFPLILNAGGKVKIPNGYNLDQTFRIQILDLGDLSTAARFTYIPRHTNDGIPDDILEEFKARFPDIASAVHNG